MAVSALQQQPVDGSLSAIEPPNSVPSPPTPRPQSKRTAQCTLGPPAKRRRLSGPHLSAQSRSASPTGTRPPEPSSYNDIIRENNRDRLFVEPLQWKSQHLRLLDCQFVPKEAGRKSKTKNAEGCVPDNTTCGRQQHQTVKPEAIIRAASQLSLAYSATLKTSVVRCLLEDHDIHRSNPDLPFRFNQHVVATLQTDGAFSPSPSPSATPTLAYLDLETVGSRRDMSVKTRTCDRVNPPITRLRRKHQRRLRPTNEVEDPYIAAVLIALAQERRHRQTAEEAITAEILDSDTTSLKSNPSARPSVSEATKTTHETATYFKVHLLALTTDARSFYFYTARIPSAFLDRFDQPSRYFPSNPVLISYYHIPLKHTTAIRAMDRVISTVRNETL